MHKRQQKLVRPKDQRQILFLFALSAALSVVLNAAINAWSLANLSAELPNDSNVLHGEIPGMIVENGLLALGLALPLFLLLGITASFRVFGPLHRFGTFLRGVADGTHPEPCKIRDRDCFQDLCELLNEVTEPLRGDQKRSTGPIESGQVERDAA